MAYLTNMPDLCRQRATRPEHALDLLDSMKREFDKSFDGGIFDPVYVLQKLDSLRRHVKWLEHEANKEFAAQCEDEGDEDQCSSCLGTGGDHDLGCTFLEDEDSDDSEQFSRGFNGGYGQSTLEDDG